MRYMLLLCAVMLAGCQATVPIKPSFPEAPEVLLRPCSHLDTISEQEVKFSQFLFTVTGNYKKYHSCADKVESWQEWYTEQKKKFEESNDPK